MKTRLLALLSAALFARMSLAAPVKIELPPEGGTLKPAPGLELVSGQCLICHSSEYISTQPPLSPTAWKATVEKMQKKFGAPVPPDQVEALVAYLVKSYGAATAAVKTAPGSGK